MYYYGRDKRRRNKRKRRIALISVCVLGAIASSYFLFFNSHNNDDVVAVDPVENSLAARKILSEKDHTSAQISGNEKSLPLADAATAGYQKPFVPKDTNDNVLAVDKKAETKKAVLPVDTERDSPETDYKVISIAHFYSEPDEQTRRKTFINYWNNSYASIKPLDERDGFIYVVFKNHLGQTTKGWLRKRDLKRVKGGYENTEE